MMLSYGEHTYHASEAPASRQNVSYTAMMKRCDDRTSRRLHGAVSVLLRASARRLGACFPIFAMSAIAGTSERYSKLSTHVSSSSGISLERITATTR